LSSRPGPFVTSPHLTGLLILTARLVQEQVANRLQALGVSYAQAVVLIGLYRSAAGSVPQTDMIESLAVSRASGTLVLAQLEARGLVSRASDPGDARRLVISLTGAGRDLEQPVYDVFQDVESVILRSLRPAEVSAAFDMARRMLEDIRRHRSTRT
jgi:MarR family transcriptional regulator, organic hydroperoxide resistance regulator